MPSSFTLSWTCVYTVLKYMLLEELVFMVMKLWGTQAYQIPSLLPIEWFKIPPVEICISIMSTPAIRLIHII